MKTDATNEQGGMDVEDKGEQQQPAQTDGKTKCKFFPFCKKENCPFFHPTEKVWDSSPGDANKIRPMTVEPQT